MSAVPEQARSEHVSVARLSVIAAALARCECRVFQSFPSSATVRSSPSGTKIGS